MIKDTGWFLLAIALSLVVEAIEWAVRLITEGVAALGRDE